MRMAQFFMIPRTSKRSTTIPWILYSMAVSFPSEQSTVLDLTGDEPVVVVRKGQATSPCWADRGSGSRTMSPALMLASPIPLLPSLLLTVQHVALHKDVRDLCFFGTHGHARVRVFDLLAPSDRHQIPFGRDIPFRSRLDNKRVPSLFTLHDPAQPGIFSIFSEISSTVLSIASRAALPTSVLTHSLTLSKWRSS